MSRQVKECAEPVHAGTARILLLDSARPLPDTFPD